MPKSAPAVHAPTTPCLDTLMAQHDGLVHAVLRRQRGGTLSYERRLHAGRIGLWQALQGYDPTRGTAFSTYAWPAIARQVWRAVRLGAPRLAAPPSLASPSQDPDEVLLHEEVLQALHALIGRLPAQLRQVVIAYYGLGDSSRYSLSRASSSRSSGSDFSSSTISLMICLLRGSAVILTPLPQIRVAKVYVMAYNYSR